MAKGKDKKGKKDEVPPEPEEEVLVNTTDLEPEPEEVQFTETSYTSASFESLPPVIEEVKPKKKGKGKKKVEAVEEVAEKADEEFNWSEESLPVEEQAKVEEEQVQEKKGKKGKKGKKEKEKEEIPEFEKPKNWKKMNKKEREAWMVQRIEEWRAEKEAEKQAILAGAKEKRATLARERAELMAKDNSEQEVRRDILQKTVNLFQKFERQKINFENKKQLDAEWQQYLRCDGLPDPRVVTQMNTYLHLWEREVRTDDDELDKRCVETLPMLEMLEEFVANSRQYTALQAQSYNEVRLALRAQLSFAIEIASYTLLRDLEKHLKFESIKLAIYQREFKGLRLNLWVAVRMPTRKRKPIEPEPEPVELAFPSMKVAVKLPKIIDGSCVCVRAARSMIDLLSESSRSYALVADLPNRYQDLFVYNVKEHIETYKLKKEQDDIRSKFYKEIREKVRELENFLKANPYTKNEKEKDDLDNLNMQEPPFLPDPRTFIGEQNELAFAKYLKTCLTRTRAGEVNLRKYRICGGVLNLDLITTPPQPKKMRNAITLTTFQLPKALQPMKYQVQYRAPSPPPPGVTRTPEEIEADMKRTEAEYEKLALVYIDLPQDMMWSEPPVVCQWQEQRKLWTSNYVNDFKFNEDKLTVQFRTGVLWPIGIATLRYSNMPYQGWDMKPDPDGKGVIITVTGASVTVTWLCVGNSVRLKWIANATTPALKEHFNKPYSVKRMTQLPSFECERGYECEGMQLTSDRGEWKKKCCAVGNSVRLKWIANVATPALKEHFNKPYSVKRMTQIMREAACDFFPDFDGHSHLEGSCPKEWVLERHNYHAMAFLSRSYNFQWSRWNATAGSRNIVMQLREAVDKKREGKFQLLHVTPQRANILKINEMAQEFNPEPMMGLPFFPDLFTLNMSYGSVDARRTTFNMKYRLVETVFGLLQELKLSSFS